jgi:hypothetical protein
MTSATSVVVSSASPAASSTSSSGRCKNRKRRIGRLSRGLKSHRRHTVSRDF